MLQSFVLETASNPGAAATANLLGAQTGFDSFINAYGAGGACFYVMTDGTGREEGFGTVTAGTPNVLNRTTVVRSTNANARVNFNGTVRIFSFLLASEAFFRNPSTTDFHLGTTPMGPLAGFRNLIINGNPIVNQRGYVSGTATTGANQYTLDRWRVVTSGQAVTWTDSAGIRTVTAPAGGMEQVIEGGSILGGQHTLSWTGTATATVNGSAVTNGGQVTLTGGTDATIRMTGGTWSLLQLERGGKPTAFERRPVGMELTLCQRYFESSYSIGTAPGTVTSVGARDILCSAGGFFRMAVVFAVEKRATPTVVLRSPTTGSTGVARDVNAAVDRASASINAGTGSFVAQDSGAFTASGPASLHFTADAEL